MRDKRNLVIGDESNVSIGLTLWGDACECLNFEVGQVAIFQNCRVSDYNGKTLNGGTPKDITISSKHPRFIELSKWAGSKKVSSTEMKSLTTSSGNQRAEVYTLKEMEQAVLEDFDMQSGEKAAYFTVNGFCSWIYVP